MRSILRLLLRVFYRYRAANTAVLDTPGPVLLLPTHVSWLDWLFLLAELPADWKFVTSSTTAQTSFAHRWLMLNHRCFPIETTSPYAVKRMAEFLQTGGRLVLFPEGRLSRTGFLMKLFDGTGFLIHKTRPRVITAYLRGANRLPFSPNRLQKRWFPAVTVHYSRAWSAPEGDGLTTAQARERYTGWLRGLMTLQRFEVEMELGPRHILTALSDAAGRYPKRLAIEDISRTTLTYRRLLVAADLLAAQWDRSLRDPAERVGVLLPNVNAMPVTLMSLWAAGRVPAVLNFSTGPAMMLACAELAGLKQIVTSRAFLEKAKLKLEPLIQAGIELVYLEDVRARIGAGAKLAALLRRRFTTRFEAAEFRAPDDTAVILFTSGSEGVPKGVELTHRSMLANLQQMLAIIDLNENDRLFNALPLFHSFGLSVGMLLGLMRGAYIFLYPTPLHYRVVPTVFYDRDCTVMLGTNTFLNGYARKANPYDFRSLRYLFAAAEKVQEATAQTWMKRFGVRILEGYGATECSPCLCVNVPTHPRHGSVGQFLPGLEWRVEPVEGVGAPAPEAAGGSATPPAGPPPAIGRLFVRGPNVMRGYLNADANAKFKALDGWYDTGDIVSVDASGFVTIEGRMKRFAKVSGEMVSLTAVEDALAGAFPHYGLRCQIAVIARPDEHKGEALIAVSNEARLTLEEIRTAIKAKGLTNLCVPREVKFAREIPKLGTGKVNHRELERILREQ